jgi:hypothetical protein
VRGAGRGAAPVPAGHAGNVLPAHRPFRGGAEPSAWVPPCASCRACRWRLWRRRRCWPRHPPWTPPMSCLILVSVWGAQLAGIAGLAGWSTPRTRITPPQPSLGPTWLALPSMLPRVTLSPSLCLVRAQCSNVPLTVPFIRWVGKRVKWLRVGTQPLGDKDARLSVRWSRCRACALAPPPRYHRPHAHPTGRNCAQAPSGGIARPPPSARFGLPLASLAAWVRTRPPPPPPHAHTGVPPTCGSWGRPRAPTLPH